MATFIVDLGFAAAAKQLYAPQALSTTTTTSSVDMAEATGPLCLVADVGAVSGTATPQVAIQLQDSPDDSTYTNIADGTMTLLTANASSLVFSLPIRQTTGRYIKAVMTVSGSNPSFTMGLFLIAQRHIGGSGGGSDLWPQNS